MERRVEKVVWTSKSVKDLRDVYLFYSSKSNDIADRILQEIIEKTDGVTFPEQYQIDDFNPSYRRIIVRHYKVLYKVKGRTIYVMAILDSRKSIEEVGD